MLGLKIGLVTGIYPPTIGGPAQQVSTMSKKLHEEGFHVSVITPRIRKFPGYEKKDGVEIYRVKSRTPIRPFKLSLKITNITASLLKLIKRGKIDILHAHTIPVGGIPSFFSNILTNIPFVLKYPADWVWETLSKTTEINPSRPIEEIWKCSAKAKFLSEFQQILFKKCNFAITTTLFQKGILEKMSIPAKRIKVIPNAVDTTKFHPTQDSNNLRKILNLQNCKVVLTGGRLAIYKGTKYLIMSAPEILKSIPETKFLIIGEGREELNLKKIAKRLNVYDRILFLGNIAHEMLPKYLALADVVVIPSLYETFGILAIEALAMEKPVIASNIGGLPEVVDHMKTGILVPPRDHESLANRIILLLLNKKLANDFGKEGRNIVLRNFSWQQIITKIKQLYVEIAHSNAF